MSKDRAKGRAHALTVREAGRGEIRTHGLLLGLGAATAHSKTSHNGEFPKTRGKKSFQVLGSLKLKKCPR